MAQVRIRKTYQEEKREQWVFAFQPNWPYMTVGFGSERDYLIENVSLLVAGGVGISGALASIEPGIKNLRLRRAVHRMREMVDAGFPFWEALTETRCLPGRAISLIKSGEQSGRLPEHLSLVTVQQHKDKIFASRIRSALLYPGIILGLAFVVSIGSAWVTLPRFVSVLEQSVQIPWPTRVVIWLGKFLGSYGLVAVPLTLGLVAAASYVLFFYKKTRVAGERVLLLLPGVNKLIQGVEMARFGFVFGSLLNAGLSLSECFDALEEGTSFVLYRRFFEYAHKNMLLGQSLHQVFASYKGSERLVPLPIQQLLAAAETSGKLPDTLLRVGLAFEEKTDAMSKDLGTILEPIVLIIVGVVVGFVALAVLSPIYSIVQQIGS